MFDPKVRSAVVGLCVRLGRSNVWRFTVTAGADATPDGILRELGLTAANQCTSFSASVLANAVRPSCRSWPMAMADTQATFDLVCADSSCGCFDLSLIHI